MFFLLPGLQLLMALTLSSTDVGYASICDRSAGYNKNNAYMCSRICGIWGGVAIGLITPVIAFWRGILPPPLGPMISFYCIGECCFGYSLWTCQ